MDLNDSETFESTKGLFASHYVSGYIPRDQLSDVMRLLDLRFSEDDLSMLFDHCGSDERGQVKCKDFLDWISGTENHPSKIWQETDAVCFDVDSTVTQEEGIDKLAARSGKGEEVAHMTKQAMGGGLSFRSALEMRLNIIQPHRSFVNQVAAEPVPLTPGIKNLINELHRCGKKVFLISGGFRMMIAPVAAQLGIPEDNIYANTLLFDSQGAYAGFSHEEPTSQTGGKARAVAEIMTRHGLKKVAMVGDGVTDMEAKPPAAVTVGFGGNIAREKVKQVADFYVCNFEQLQRLASRGCTEKTQIIIPPSPDWQMGA